MDLDTLKQFRNVPVSTGELKTLLTDYRSPEMKIHSLEREGVLISLKRGLYLVSPRISGKSPMPELNANRLYGPSYVSLHYALRRYGLIPEEVYRVTSMTTRHTRQFENPLGVFSYRGVKTDYFSIGLAQREEEGTRFIMATPEKSLCDTILETSYLPSRSVRGLEVFLEEDLRLDMDALKDFDLDVVERCAAVGNKKDLFRNLIILIKKLKK